MQARHISLFGWGGSKDGDFKAAHVGIDSKASPAIDVTTVESPRAFKAIYSAADGSDLQSQSPSPIEPQILEDIQKTIAEPHTGTFTDSIDPNAPEQLGYLYDVCGLDFGWGPTSICQFMLEHFHFTFGLSWTASIVCIGLMIRGALFPLNIVAASESAKMRAIQPVMAPLRSEYQEAMKSGDQTRAIAIGQQIRVLSKESGASVTKMFLPILIQLPMGFGAWRLLRNCGTLPVPAFITESWLWTHDLTFSDPTYITPFLASGILWLTLRNNMKLNQAQGVSNQNFMSLMASVMPFLTFAFTCFQPGSVQLYILSSTSVALVSTRLLANNAFRSAVGLPPNVIPNAQAPNVINVVGRDVSKSKNIQNTPVETASQRSKIDQYVDAGKGIMGNFQKSWRGLMSDVSGGTGTSKLTKAQQEKIDEFERNRKRAREQDRRDRNERNTR